jgi:hypothetical protein
VPKQGDQIGRIFDRWVTVNFGQYFENYTGNPHFCATFSTVKIFFDKNPLGYSLGDFFQNSSAHLVPKSKHTSGKNWGGGIVLPTI